jgi:hypothetical protein
MVDSGPPSLVLIDDDPELLKKLAEQIAGELAGESFEIKSWSPQDGDNPSERFSELVDDHTVAVITDSDLTQHGLNGLFGATIVSWCQARPLPVADFSRGNVADLPNEPNLFELRLPSGTEEAARYAAAVFRGFKQIYEFLASNEERLKAMRSPAQALAVVLEQPHFEGQFALYMSRLGASNSTLLEKLRAELTDNGSPDTEEKARLLTYVVGHVLVNAVLRYPGPILSMQALCAYVSTAADETEALSALFGDATYEGPFASVGPALFWRKEVDGILSAGASDLEASFETFGEFNRAVVEKLVGRGIATHGCLRCGGTNGGYLCPFTNRPVCERADCSVAANSWIPAGADICRIERDFYDEWAPLIGL